MATKIIEAARIQHLNERDAPGEGKYVLYWMQRAQRAEHNDALELAIQGANEREQPLLVVFGLTDDYPEANLRHFTFMLEGLQETQQALARRGIRLIVRRGSPPEVALGAAEKASLLVCDRGYLRHLRAWREQVAAEAPCPVIQVETDVVVPVQVASQKREYAARTFRPRVQQRLDQFLVERRTTPLDHHSLELEDEGVDLSHVEALLDEMEIDRSVPAVSALYKGGTRQARRRLNDFIEAHLPQYDEHRNQPETDDVSHMAMYLHFGQISPVYVALAIRDSGAPQGDVDSYLEELIVRRELAINFTFYTPHYDQFEALPDWARETLAEHRDDEREHIYSREELAAGETHDPYWNAAMAEMRSTGYMHNYMRMYWGKKILEWSGTPEEAYESCLAINNRYFLCGRDPASYANVGWIFGLHDRAWGERPVYGKVRYLSAGGLERKADPEAYVEKVERLRAEVGVAEDES
ncbi:MAG: deoxyribodipyrimidine photo-lyase [Candidatus Promineifilaceae bacterium]|nr:deoxyribodipyrimidine photo-lyase [Candidatus Promineifilaceae bacterium]